METPTLEKVPQAIQDISIKLDRIEELLKIQPLQESNQMFTVPEVAEYLSLSVPSIYRYISQRLIPHKKIPGQKRVYFIKSEVDRWIQDHGRKTLDELQIEITG